MEIRRGSLFSRKSSGFLRLSPIRLEYRLVP
jgi:hypothetical protein